MASPLNSKDRIKEEMHFEDETTKQRREADKTFYTQKSDNELLFTARNYIELDFIINQAHNLIQQLEEEKKIVENENEKLHYQQKNEEKFNESIKKYNEALQQMAVRESKPENIELITRWDDLINKIQQELARLMSYIQSLDREIHKIQLEIVENKNNFVDQVKKTFTESNSNINFTSRKFSFMIPTIERQQIPGADRFQGNIILDKEFFVKLANRVADDFSDEKVNFSDLEDKILLHARKMMRDKISEKLAAGMPNLSTEEQERIIKSLLNQNKIKHEIESIRTQLYDAFSKQPAIAATLAKGQHLEEKGKSLIAKRATAATKVDGLYNIFEETTSPQSSQFTSAEASAAIAAVEKAYNDLTQKAEVAKQTADTAVLESPSLDDSLDFLKPSEPAPPEAETVDDENKNERSVYRP